MQHTQGKQEMHTNFGKGRDHLGNADIDRMTLKCILEK